MARVTGILENLEGKLDDNFTIVRRPTGSFTYPAHIRQPRRLSRKQLAIRERQSHNNALWRALKESGHTYFEGNKPAYYRFMSLNMESPIPYIPKHQFHSGNALLLPNMILSEGPLKPVGYQLGEVDNPTAAADTPGTIPALITDLTKTEAQKDQLLLYVLRQRVITHQDWPDQFYLHISAVPITLGQDIEIPHVGIVRLINVPSTLLMPFPSKSGTLALIGDIFADPMLGFGIVRINKGHASTQHVVTRCTYYEQYTTEEALQAAAKSYKGLTGER